MARYHGRLSEERRQQMPYPSLEFIPSRSPLVPLLLSKEKAVLLLSLEVVVELTRGALVEDNGILLTVPTQAPRVEIC